MADGLGIEVLVQEVSATLRQQITEQLQAAGISVSTLKLVTDAAQLVHPLPWHGDLHEHSLSD